MARRHNKVGIAPQEPEFPVHEDENRPYMYGLGDKDSAALTLEDLPVETGNKKYRICLLGAGHTGKSAYLRQICGKELTLNHRYTPTNREKRERINHFRVTDTRKVDLMVYDFGTECQDYSQLLVRNIERADGYMIFFYDEEPSTWDAVENFATRISDYKDIKDQTIAVMGMRSQVLDWRQRNVSQSEVRDWVRGWRERYGCFMDFFPFSADSSNHNVDQAMRYVTRGIMLKAGNILRGNDPYDAHEHQPSLTSSLTSLGRSFRDRCNTQ